MKMRVTYMMPDARSSTDRGKTGPILRWLTVCRGNPLEKGSISGKKCHSNRQVRSTILLRGTGARINLEKPPYHLSTQQAPGKCAEAESEYRFKEPARKLQCLEEKV